MKTKQVIVMRKDLKMRRGKQIAQGAHASIKTLLDNFATDNQQCGSYVLKYKDSPIIDDWLNGIFTKICVSVNSEKELLDVYNKANKAGLPCSIIEDNGLTEFNGVKTKTCLAIGPFYSEQIDTITGDLPLL